MIGLGIDTGGTCTDAVIYDSEKGGVLSAAKTQTTKRALEEGIEKAILLLDPEHIKQVRFVSLSTTLATNACVENRGGKVRLLFIGANRKVLKNVYKEYGFESLDDIAVIDGTPEGGYSDPVPFDEDALSALINEGFFADAEAIGIVQVHPERGNDLETRAREILSEHYNVPVIQGSALFSDLNIIRRGAGTYLNVRLIPVIKAFLRSVKTVMDKIGLQVPIYIVRSDGTLMNEEFALAHPVETLLCGPAASALGGAWMSDEEDAVIVDIGGTTTDIAILKEDAALTVDDGIKINGWKTFVKGMFIDTFGLGGDSAIHYENKKVFLESYRIIPICMAASEYPVLREKLEKLSRQKYYFEKNPYEGFVLLRDLPDDELDTDWQRMFCGHLRKGPLLIAEAKEIADKYMFDRRIYELESQEIIMRFGLTPTDMMHLKGDFVQYDAESAKYAVHVMSRVSAIPEEDIPDMVYEAFIKKLTVNIERILIERGRKKYHDGVSEDIRTLLSALYDNETEGFYKMDMFCNMPIIGVGGPSYIFMDKVAEHLHTTAIHPEYAKVANAVGTLAGRVVVKETLEIVYRSTCAEPGYCYFLDGVLYSEEKFDDAAEKGKAYLIEKTAATARERGARGEVTHKAKVNREENVFYSSLFLYRGSVTVTAYGSII